MKPFEYMKLSVRFNALESEVYPYFLGSFIRGNFGIYLKKALCPFGLRKDCDGCIIHKKCFYGEIFEPEKQESTSGKDIPHPFVLDIIDSQSSQEQKSSHLSFNMILFGPALKNVEFFILVFSLMSKNGIGKNRVKCREVIVEDERGRLVYSSIEQKIVHMPQPLRFQFGTQEPCRKVKIQYRSPVRLKREGQWVGTPDFETLIRASLRRVLLLQQFYGSTDGYSSGEIIETCAPIKNISSDVQWVKQLRYSNRKNTRMNLGGIVGTQVFEGNILPIHLDLLKFVSIFHLGKSSSFGQGKITIEIEEGN